MRGWFRSRGMSVRKCYAIIIINIIINVINQHYHIFTVNKTKLGAPCLAQGYTASKCGSPGGNSKMLPSTSTSFTVPTVYSAQLSAQKYPGITT